MRSWHACRAGSRAANALACPARGRAAVRWAGRGPMSPKGTCPPAALHMTACLARKAAPSAAESGVSPTITGTSKTSASSCSRAPLREPPPVTSSAPSGRKPLASAASLMDITWHSTAARSTAAARSADVIHALRSEPAGRSASPPADNRTSPAGRSGVISGWSIARARSTPTSSSEPLSRASSKKAHLSSAVASALPPAAAKAAFLTRSRASEPFLKHSRAMKPPGTVGEANTCPSNAGGPAEPSAPAEPPSLAETPPSAEPDASSVVPMTVSEVPSDTATSPGRSSRRPAKLQGLSPDHATAAQPDGRP
mmetsp:Transcript_23361/g.88630  ORF Transcript_23361/g.88630 Transcript_23361/m.88630 type:complete len:311 (-) Transcript_23361:871-1803(-)